MPYEPIGGEFLVNTSTSGAQLLPDTAALTGGGYIICWTDPSGVGGDSSGFAIKAQLYAADGTPVGGEFLVNTTTLADQKVAQVAALENGGFAITWFDYSNQGADSSGSGIVVRLYAADGTPVTGEIAVNTIVNGDQVEPYVAGIAGGGFVVTWIDYSNEGGDTSVSAVRAQVYAADGSPVGGEILVNTETNHYQIQPQVAGLENGNFVITWADRSGLGGDSSSFGVKAQLFAPDGAKIGGEFLVNTELPNEQADPTITGLVGGGFVITWNDHSGLGADTSGWGIKAQIYDANGAPVGGEFLVNNVTYDDQQGPSIAALPNGGFIVTWMDYAGTFGGAGGGIKARVFGADGTPDGSEFLVNSIDDNRQLWPDVAAQSDGSFLITWGSNGAGGDGSDYGIKAQLFEGPPPVAESTPHDDAFATTELAAITGNLFADNGSGADEGDALAISAVNGVAASVGTQITLASGALLTVNADGTFSYDPNGAFEAVPGQYSGAANLTGTDRFTYTVNGGATATATVTLTGVDNDDRIVADGGSQFIHAGPGSDTLVLSGNRADYVIEPWGGYYLRVTNTVDSSLHYIIDIENFEFADQTVSLADLGPFTVNGTPGGDYLYGSYADDQLFGGGGGDRIDGGYTGSDLLDAGDGNDTLIAGAGTDTLLGGDGDDFLGPDQNFGSFQDDFWNFYDDNAADHLDGGAGFDLAVLHFDNATADIVADFSDPSVMQTLADGTTVVNVEQLQVRLGSGNDTVNFGAGDDWAYAGSGNDTIDGGAGNDLIWGDEGNDTLIGGAGNDYLSDWSGNDTLLGGDGDDQLDGGVGDDLLDGGDGYDTARLNFSGANAGVSFSFETDTSVTTSQGTTTLANIEAVQLEGSNFADQLTGGSQNDGLWGGDGDDVLNGSGGNDTLHGGYNGNDTLSGGEGDDFLIGGSGNDTLDGGAGLDRTQLYFGGQGAGVNFSLASNPTLVTDFGTKTLISIEGADIYGTVYADTITGGEASDYISGWDGNDVLSGGGGNDTLIGGMGNDTLDGGEGLDRTRLNFYTSNGVNFTLTAYVVATDYTGTKTLISIEGADIYGSNYADTITGGVANDLIYGGAGNDVLSGGDGDDNIQAGYGSDTLDGGAGNDQMYGGDGICVMTGGAGNDTLQGYPNGSTTAVFSGPQSNYQFTLGSYGSLLVTDITGADGIDTLWGIDSLQFSDGTISIEVAQEAASNQPAVAQDDGFTTDELTPVSGDLFADNGFGPDSDPDGPPLSISAVNGSAANVGTQITLPSGALLTVNADGSFNYDPNGAFEYTPTFGSGAVNTPSADTFSYTLAGGDSATVIFNINGVDNDDTIFGSDANDFLTGGAGSDVLFGADGNDTLRGDFGDFNNTVAGNDIIDGGAGNDILRGGLGDDQLYGGDNNDLLRGGGGTDYYDGGADDGLGYNGIGDRVSFFDPLATQGVVADLGTGVVSNDGYGNVETMVGIESLGAGTAFADTFYGNDTANFLAGDRGDNLYGLGGDDVFQIGSAPAVIDGASGNDTVNLYTNGGWYMPDSNGDGIAESAPAATAGWVVGLNSGTITDGYGNSGSISGIENINGSDLNDRFTGNFADNILHGGGGSDALQGRGGNDQLFGDDGDDYLSGGLGDDLMDGGAGADRAAFANQASAGVTVDLRIQGVAQNTGLGMDTLVGIENLSGTVFADTLIGDDNANWIWGVNDGPGAGDTIQGNGGNDLIEIGAGDHILDGGADNDTLLFNPFGTAFGGTSSGATISLALQGAAQDTGAGVMTLTNFENLSGSDFVDTLIGDGNANILAGGQGGDTLSGGAGNDSLYGDGFMGLNSTAGNSGSITFYPDVATLGGVDGNDVLEGGLGDDQLWGGGGSDTASYANAAGGVQAFIYDGGFGEAFGADGYDQLHDIENLTGSAFNDVLFGSNLDNVLSGGDGIDMLRGRVGNDTLLGGDGDDYLDGGLGDDILDGGAGWDRLSYFGSATGPVTIDLRIQGVAQDTGQGMDTLIGIEHTGGTVFNDTLTGNEGDNWLRGSSDSPGSVDTIDGQGGNDLISDGAGDHILTGGAGSDTFAYETNSGTGINVSLALQGAAQNTGVGMMTLSGFENLSGNSGADNLSGDGNANVLAGGEGGDTLVGGAGDDSLYGDGAITIDTHGTGLSGPINLVTDVVTIGGVDGNDTLEGGLGDDVIDGGGGIDTASYANAAGGVEVFLYRNGNGNGESAGADGYDLLYNIENITGSAFNDQLGGNNLDNVISGGDGHDGLRGNGGNDTLYGGAGDDFLNGSAGNDYIDGGAGSDRAAFYEDATSAGVTVDLNLQGIAQDTGQGMDTLIGIENVSGSRYGDTLIGDDNDNWLWGSAATLNGVVSADNNDTLIGNGGNDLLIVGIGNHTLDGGSGIDTVRFTENGAPETGITLSLLLAGAQATGNGSWTLTGIENLSGSTSGDTLTGDGNANVLAGDLGNDNLVGGAGNDTLYGDGQIMWDGHGTGGSGPITTWADATGNYVGGVAGNDTLEGGLGDDIINGGGGTDTASYANASGAVTVQLFNNGGGNGVSSGADGNDTLSGIENLTGSAFNDLLIGNALGNVLSGGDGHDSLRGNGGDDTIVAGAGDDLLYGNAGNDILDGGAGYDRVGYFSGATAGVTVDLNIQGVAQNTGQGLDILIGIEHATGTAFSDTLTGDGGANWLGGQSDGTADTIYGNGGDDLITNGAGDHMLDGGTGIDTFSFGSSIFLSGVTISLAAQGGSQNTGAGMMTLSGFENLSGSGYGDTLTGDGGANVLAGQQGNDILVGGAGNDSLYGDGQFYIDTHGLGGSGPISFTSDVATFGWPDGDDVLEGGLGDDLINGGGGTDTASYTNALGAVTVNLAAGTSSGADGNDTLSNIENLIGGAFSDTLSGNEQANQINGGDGDDFVRANGGNDQVFGGNGNDILKGQGGDDLIDGGAGIDRAGYWHDNSALGGVTVSLLLQGTAQNTGSMGLDTLVGIENVFGTPFADTLTGDNGDNWLSGSEATLSVGNVSASNNDTLDGQGGNDLLAVGIGNHTVIGGTGNDTLWFSENGFPESGITVSLASQGSAQATGNGSWTLTGIENLTGGVANDMLTGDGNANVLGGGAGSDTLVGGAGNDILYGDGGIAVDGHDVITTFTDVATIVAGGIGADVAMMPGVDGNDTLEGGMGDDVLNGGGGTDTASYANASGSVTVNLAAGTSSGADGNDTLSNIENLLGGVFTDNLTGNGQANQIDGGGGHDKLFGGGGDDVLLGGAGDDTLSGGAGNDTINGGAGFDRASYFGASAGVTVSLAIAGVQNTGSAGMDTLIGIENLTGTQFSDTLIGNAGDNWLWGFATTAGTVNNDTLDGGAGNDLLWAGNGNMTLIGGTGNDTVMYNQNFSGDVAVTLTLVNQGVAQNTGQGMWTLTGIENLVGGTANDTLTGDGNANILCGSAGTDTINGGAGNDTIFGDGEITIDEHGTGGSGPLIIVGDAIATYGGVAGNDVLSGGDGDDFIYGGAGNDVIKGDKDNDTLYGGTGNDTLTGGNGNDRYVIEAISGADTISGFAHLVDKIVFDDSSGVTSFAQLTLTKVGTNTLITWGNGNSITLTGLRPSDVSAADFQFNPAAAGYEHVNHDFATSYLVPHDVFI